MKPGSRRLGAFLIAAFLGHPVAAGAEDRWFASDKARHVGATAAIAAGSYSIASAATTREKWRVLIGAGSGIGAAAAKEIWDRSQGDPSWRDFTWGAIGTAAGVMVASAIGHGLRRRHPASPHKPPQTALDIVQAAAIRQ